MKSKAQYTYNNGGFLDSVSQLTGGLAAPAAVLGPAGPFISAGLGAVSAITGLISNAQNQKSSVPAVMQQTQYAAGGPMFPGMEQMAEDQLTSITSGGTHEQNAMGGVPVGLAPDGSQNLVEEGETILNREDYVFSDRLYVNKTMAEDFSLPKSLIGKSFAEASKKLEVPKTFKNDIYSVKGSDKMMDRLMYAQEFLRMETGLDQQQGNTFAYGGEMSSGTNPSNLSYNLILARQLFKESSFNPEAYNEGSKAKGIAQFVPKTWEMFQKATGKTDYTPDNPVQALEAQQWYMNYLQERPWIKKEGVQQSPEVIYAKMLAAYNWGEGNMLNFLNKKKEEGADIYTSTEWIKDLPEESKDYVNKILFGTNEKFEKQFQDAYSNWEYKDLLPANPTPPVPAAQGLNPTKTPIAMPDNTQVAMPNIEDMKQMANETYNQIKGTNIKAFGGPMEKTNYLNTRKLSVPQNLENSFYLEYPASSILSDPTSNILSYQNKGLNYIPDSPYLKQARMSSSAPAPKDVSAEGLGLFNAMDIGRAVPIVSNLIRGAVASRKEIEDPFLVQMNLRSGLKPIDTSGLKSEALAAQRAYNNQVRESSRGNAGMMQQGFRAGQANLLGNISNIATQAQMMNNQIAAQDADFMSRQALGNAQLAAGAYDQRMRALAAQQAYADTNLNAAMTGIGDFFREKTLAGMLTSATGYTPEGLYAKAILDRRMEEREKRKNNPTG